MTDTRMLHSVNWRAITLDRDKAKTLGDEFQLSFLKSIVQKDPDNIEILVQLGDLYSKLSYVEESLKIDLKLVNLFPEEKVFHYNLSCSYSLLKDLDSSLLALEKALLLGYDDFEQIQSDADLSNLRKDRRFHQLMMAHFNRELQP